MNRSYPSMVAPHATSGQVARPGAASTREDTAGFDPLPLSEAIRSRSASPAPSGQGVSGADLSYERQYFERGMFAAYAWMVTNRSGSLLADAVVDNAWENRDAGMSAEDILPVRAPAPSCAPGEVERAFRPMEAWDQRDEAVLLLVDYDNGDHPLDDARFAITIGHNNDHNVGDDEGQGWRFAGWCWSHDHYVEGKGKPVGWMPIPHILARAYAAFDGEPAALSPQGLDAKEGGKPVAWVSPGQLAAHNPGPNDNRYLPVVKEPGGNFTMPLYATPSQRLDAATVERCAQVADFNVTNGQSIGWSTGAKSIAEQIRALATEPHQHGGKGA